MHRFKIYFYQDGYLVSNILALVKEYMPNKDKCAYRFINLTTDSLLPESFRNPAAALRWLDGLELVDWTDVTGNKSFI